MTDLLQTEAGDLELTQGSMTITDGSEETKQRIYQALRTFLGEWFLDLTEGVPYYEDILRKNPNPRVAEDALKRAILKVEGVVELKEFLLEVDRSARQARCTFRALSLEGELEGAITI